MTPTHRVEHVLESCPECGSGVTGGWVQRTREVIDLPVAPAEVAEHVYIARTCPMCDERRVPPADLAGVALGKQRLGVNLLRWITALREEGRLPLRTIQWYLSTVHQLRLSLGPSSESCTRWPEGVNRSCAHCGPHSGQPRGPRR